MTRITFLHGAADRLQAAASWLGQACREGRRVHVYAPNDGDLTRLDRLLWMQPPTGFTPHCNADSPLAADTPIVLSPSPDRSFHDECLVNLSDEIPSCFGRFEHLIEVISTADADRLPGRERFRFYRDRGYEMEARDLATEAA